MWQRLLIAAGLLALTGLMLLIVHRYQRWRAGVAIRREHETGECETDGATDVRPRVLYFRSDTCTTCEAQSRLFEQLDPPMRQIIERIDVDREPARASAYNVLTLPTIMVIDAEGEVRHVNYGVVSPAKLRSQVAEAQRV